MISIFGPVAIGAVIGWMLYYFIRLYKLFNPKTLAATLTALLGGKVLEFISTIEKTHSSSGDFANWYFLGVGIGFFAYAIYAGIISLLFASGKIRSRTRFEVAIACGAGISEELDLIENIMEFEDYLKKWFEGNISDDDFISLLPNLKIRESDYIKCKINGDLNLPIEIVERFESEGFKDKLRKDKIQ